MKILITTDWYATGTNGVITSVKNLCEEMTSNGHDVRILTLSENIHSHKDGNVYCIGSLPVGVYPDARVTVRPRHPYIDELIEWKPDVIHSQCEISTMPYANRISKLTGAPIVHTYHTMYEQYVGYIGIGKRIGKRVVRFITRRRLKNVSVVIAPTKKIKNTLSTYSLRQRLEVIPSGISLAQHKARLTEDERAKKRQELGISPDSFVLVYVGRLGAEKNTGELIEYFSRLSPSSPELLFLIVGDGPDKENLEKAAKALSLSGKVIFTGMVPPTQVHEYYQLGDVFVCASTSEAQGLTYIEAAACGLPLLCRKDPCLSDIIVTGENGFEYVSEADFSDAVTFMTKHPQWVESAKKKSEDIAKGFDKSVFASSVQKLYSSLK